MKYIPFFCSDFYPLLVDLEIYYWRLVNNFATMFVRGGPESY